jgi:hypothetical protein
MLCPVCNGLEQLAAQCPACSRNADDCGRLSDFAGPYAPYQPDPDTDSIYNETVSLDYEFSCLHVIYCPECEKTFEAAIAKW